MSNTPSYSVHSEPRAGHWVAWVIEGSDSKPTGHVILVGQTQEEAERNAQQWADRLVADPTLRRDS